MESCDEVKRIPGIGYQFVQLTSGLLVRCELIRSDFWTVIQTRTIKTNKQSYARGWQDYKLGFGTPYINLWLGLEHIHQMTKNRDHMLRVDFWTPTDSVVRSSKYSHFSVASEQEGYTLNVTGYNEGSTAGDAFSFYSGAAFSTLDRDKTTHNCTVTFQAGWWFQGEACVDGNLNPGEVPPQLGLDLRSVNDTTNYAMMMIRPRG